MISRISRAGFSLIELMVVITIIGLVTTISLASLSAIQKNTRDSQRQSDLRIIQGALQQFYADRNYYPNYLTLTNGAAINDCTSVSTCTSISKIYLSATPKDPASLTNTPYCYTSYVSSSNLTTCVSPNPAGVCHFYKLEAMLENSPIGTGSCGSITNYNFEVTPL